MGENVNFGKLIHGGDYNPEQWLHMPEILEKILNILKRQRSTRYLWEILLVYAGTRRGSF